MAVERMIEDAHHDDPQSLDRLLESYRDYLRLLARAGLGQSLKEKADPSDLVQETLLKAYLHFREFKGRTEAELIAWLRQILSRKLIDLVRRHKGISGHVSIERSLENTLGAASRSMEALMDSRGESPSKSAQRREMGIILADALTRLPADQREVLILRTLEGRGWAEVAAEMGRSPDAVRMLWARGLRKIRPLIEERL